MHKFLTHIKKHLLKLELIIILIGSDLLIGFFGHFSGSTGNEYTLPSFIDYVAHLTIQDIAPTLIIAFIVVLYVEFRYKRKK